MAMPPSLQFLIRGQSKASFSPSWSPPPPPPVHDQSLDASSDRLLWDCGSSLYDTFELKSLLRQLDSAVAARCSSMPHAEPPTRAQKTMRSKFSRSLRKLIRSVFRPSPSRLRALDQHADGVGAGEEGSPEQRLKGAVAKAMSERFAGEAAVAAAPRPLSYGNISFVKCS